MTKTIVVATLAESKSALNAALDREDQVICISGDLYSESYRQLKKAKSKKIFKTGSAIAAGVGFFLSGPLALILFGGGLAGYFTTRAQDNLKKYQIEIDEIKERITLYLVKGKNKINPKQCEIVFSQK